MKRLAMILCAAAAALLAACPGSGPPKDQPLDLPSYKFDPEDFGIGRKHTPNAACNHQIDQLLAPILACYNERPREQCQQLLEDNNDKIRQFKNATRCRR